MAIRKEKLSPSDLEFLLWCVHSTDVHPGFDTPAIEAAVKMFQAHEMIELELQSLNGVFRLTAKGEAYMDYILRVPFPEIKWEVPK